MIGAGFGGAPEESWPHSDHAAGVQEFTRMPNGSHPNQPVKITGIYIGNTNTLNLHNPK